ncbi:MAG TPA: hypothetical protein VJV78_44880 [Polyangiales bacterium]|nr:hypothetical protein [Polyangiales bacterium]
MPAAGGIVGSVGIVGFVPGGIAADPADAFMAGVVIEPLGVLGVPTPVLGGLPVIVGMVGAGAPLPAAPGNTGAVLAPLPEQPPASANSSRIVPSRVVIRASTVTPECSKPRYASVGHT